MKLLRDRHHQVDKSACKNTNFKINKVGYSSNIQLKTQYNQTYIPIRPLHTPLNDNSDFIPPQEIWSDKGIMISID